MDAREGREVMSLLMQHGNRYSRRILKFFRWFCKWVPVAVMCFHAYGIWDFGHHPREMFLPYEENMPCYLFIYFMLYVLPMVIILASRFFFLCWKYRIPFFYFFGINAAHIVGWSWYTTNGMVDSCYTVMVVTAMFYVYGFGRCLSMTQGLAGKYALDGVSCEKFTKTRMI